MEDVFTITAGVTQSLAAWGVCKLRRTRPLDGHAGTVKFDLDGANVDSALPFAYLEEMTISKNGVPWWVGVVTDIPGSASGDDESISYEVSDPWYWVEQTPFQQQFVTADPSGGATITESTTQSDVILSQSLDAVKMNSGQVMIEVLRYVQYGYQGRPYPAVVDVNHLPPKPDESLGPFQIGLLTPSITVPYTPFRDGKCSEIIRYLLKFTPDAVKWFDFTTSPPTLNIDRRGNLPVKTIRTRGTDIKRDGYITTGLKPRPRYDLQVPGVIVKFQQNQSINGTSYLVTTVDKWPLTAKDNAPRTWLQTINLIGGSVTYAKQTISVTSRPTNNTSAPDCLTWLLNHNSTLGDSYDFSLASLAASSGQPGLYVMKVECVVDPGDPALKAPFDMPADGTGFNYERLAGAVTPWMFDQGGFLCAQATVKITFQYTGTDDATLAYFAGQPTPGTLIVPVRCPITNAGGLSGFTSATVTKEYETIASSSAAEPVPVGYAKYLQEAMAPLHWQGDLTIVEVQCSDMLPPGCVFNTSDGRAEWRTMNALVMSVTEDIESGRTTVQFGPPLMLGLDSLEELQRAQEGRLPSFRLDQRTTGKAEDGAATVQGHNHASSSSSHLPPALSSGKPVPWGGTVARSTGGATTITINPKSFLMNSPAQGDTTTVDGLGVAIPINAGAGSTDFVYLELPVANLRPNGNARVTTGSVGGTFTPTMSAWDASGKAYLANDGAMPPNQTFFRVLLGTIATGPAVGGVAPLPVYTQACINNLLIFNIFELSEPAILAYPTSSAAS